jgi:hypothetical protein
MGEIIDFTEHYMHKLIDKYAKANDEKMAWALSEALDQYITGDIGILLIDGVPVPYIERPIDAKELDSPIDIDDD